MSTKLPLIMTTQPAANLSPAPRILAASGLLITLAALVGMVLPATAIGSTRLKHHASIKAVISPTDAIYDSAGFWVITGSTLLLLVWLQQQAFRRVTAFLPVLPAAEKLLQLQVPVVDRNRLISLHIGGLYGP